MLDRIPGGVATIPFSRHGASRRRNRGRLLFAVVLGLAMAFPSAAAARKKGLPGSETRDGYCATKFADCIASELNDCSDTYAHPDHIASCMKEGTRRCERTYGTSSNCRVSPRVVSPPHDSASELAPEPARPRPMRPGALKPGVTKPGAADGIR